MIPHTNISRQQDPIRKAHYVGTSVVLTIDPSHVKRLDIDELTFFIQKPIENGILLEKRRLSIDPLSADNDNVEHKKNERC